MKVTPIGANVLIRMSDRKPMTDGGIALPLSSIRPEKEGMVVRVGTGVEHVTEGDLVGYGEHHGTRLESAGVDFLIIEEAKILYVRE